MFNNTNFSTMIKHSLAPKRSNFLFAICIILTGFLPVSVKAQTVIGGLAPDPSAMLDVQSTNKGVLFPRVPNRSSVVSPATGLMIYNDDNGCLEINLGTPGSPSWQSIKCEVRCGAYIAPGVWKRFMCYNLGAADFTADPFEPSWEINGNYFQWGQKPTCFGKDGIDAANPCTSPVYGASGPWGSSASEDNSDAISGWNTTPAEDNAWEDNSKTSADPCPEGFRVPTKTQWQGVIDNNGTPTNANNSAWTVDAINYSEGKNFGPSLMLPAAGLRRSSNGSLNDRGAYGYYWSSTYDNISSGSAWLLYFDNRDVFQYSDSKTYGKSIRCIAE